MLLRAFLLHCAGHVAAGSFLLRASGDADVRHGPEIRISSVRIEALGVQMLSEVSAVLSHIVVQAAMRIAADSRAAGVVLEMSSALAKGESRR